MSAIEIKKYQWWRKKSSGLPYEVYTVQGGIVYLLNEVGVPNGKFTESDFLTLFYQIAGN